MRDRRCFWSATRSGWLVAVDLVPVCVPEHRSNVRSASCSYHINITIKKISTKLKHIHFQLLPFTNFRFMKALKSLHSKCKIKDLFLQLARYQSLLCDSHRGISSCKGPWTNLTQAGSLLGAGCRRALELLLYARHKVGAGPRGVVSLAQGWGGAGLRVWHFEPFKTLIKFSLAWRGGENVRGHISGHRRSFKINTRVMMIIFLIKYQFFFVKMC